MASGARPASESLDTSRFCVPFLPCVIDEIGDLHGDRAAHIVKHIWRCHHRIPGRKHSKGRRILADSTEEEGGFILFLLFLVVVVVSLFSDHYIYPFVLINLCSGSTE